MNGQSRRESLDYMQYILRELCEMARANRESMLVYLIEMAYLEASDRSREAHKEAIKVQQKKAA